jgi:hypothetical protein
MLTGNDALFSLLFVKINNACFVFGKVPGSNLGLKTDYLDDVFRGFSQFLQANAGIVPEIMPRPLNSISSVSLIYY